MNNKPVINRAIIIPDRLPNILINGFLGKMIINLPEFHNERILNKKVPATIIIPAGGK
jgi:hypothetical protein